MKTACRIFVAMLVVALLHYLFEYDGVDPDIMREPIGARVP